MPVDFARVPSKVIVPEPPRFAWPFWAALFVIVTSVGAGYVLFTAPPENSSGAWFWIRVIAYPVIMWLLMLFGWLGWTSNRRQIAISTNQISDSQLRECHLQASQPLSLLAHAWCFSGDEEENGITGIVGGDLKLQPRLCMAESGSVTARWIDVPGLTLYGGTEVAELARHTTLLKWLLSKLLGQLAPVLRKLSASVALRVTLSVDAAIHPDAASELLRPVLKDMCPHLDFVIEATSETMSLFLLDSWLDNADTKCVQLLIAVQLRNAISEVLDEGAAEGGVALIFGLPAHAEVITAYVHRPAKGAVEVTDETLFLATHWAGMETSRINTAWEHAVLPSVRSAIRSSPHFNETTLIATVDATVGDCGVAGSWLTVALASQYATDTLEPQLVLVQEGEELIALTCIKQI